MLLACALKIALTTGRRMSDAYRAYFFCCNMLAYPSYRFGHDDSEVWPASSFAVEIDCVILKSRDGMIEYRIESEPRPELF